MNLSVKREPLSHAQFDELCQSIGWKSIHAENYALAVNKSIACVSAFWEGRPVGSGRLIGDVGMYLYIQDVISRGDLHGRGIGSRIVEELEAIAKGLGCRRERVGLIAAADVCGFYEQLGYCESSPPSRFLVKTLK